MLTGVNELSKWDVSRVTDMYGMFFCVQGRVQCAQYDQHVQWSLILCTDSLWRVVRLHDEVGSSDQVCSSKIKVMLCHFGPNTCTIIL